MKLRLRDELSSPGPPDSDYYFRSPINKGYSVDHFGPGGKILYNSFVVGSDDTVHAKTKHQVLLSGAFGTVYAESTYFYPPFYKDQPTEFFTVLYFKGNGGAEPFQLVPALPSAETPCLSGISVIRIFHAPPEFLVISANYAPDGHLESLHVNGSEHGEWMHSNEIHGLYPALDVATMIGDRPKTREHFGIPAEFPVKYHHTWSDVFQRVDLQSAMDVVNLHYERNLWVQQDTFLPDGAIQTRFLTYVKTSEDEALRHVDDALLFGQFPYTRGSLAH